MARRPAANPWVGVNYIPDNTKMAVPPAYWLQRLYDYDAELVVLPSRYVPYAYVLARRTHLLTDAAIFDTVKQPDTVMCFRYGVVPVSLIYRTGSNWSIDNIIRSLKARDIWAHGGGEKYADAADAVDEQQRQKIRQDIRDDMYNRSGDAWRSYQARTGQRNKHARNSGVRARQSSSGSTPGSGITLTDAVA